MARAFQCLPEPPRRSILFLGTTAEEKGLLGADYFAQDPTVPRESIVANLNVDSPLMLYPFKDVVVFGGEHSSLGRTFERAASHLGLSISPDPMPEEVIFVRSDQFPFVRHGIPAAFAIVGFESGDPEIDGAAATRTWLTTVYHTPKDDFSQKMDFETGALYARVNFLAGYLVAQSSEPPTWNDGDFFGTLFAEKQEPGR
jgi:Zn-dependent M28 family amino/carboxypeptidase